VAWVVPEKKTIAAVALLPSSLLLAALLRAPAAQLFHLGHSV
jgi:hypothetical protein